jgi:ubiquinol-cytochrome c reductase cytochrome c1 subunit
MTMRSTLAGLLALAALAGGTAPAGAVVQRELQHPKWSFEGPFGTFDRAALQRGYQVYKEVCSACHSLNYLSYRDLAAPGGPGFTPAQVEVLAAKPKVPAGPSETGDIVDENGQPLMRPALPSDHFAKPFLNDNAAKAANSGSVPPDLSLMAKAREGGPNYIYSFVSGFADDPKTRPACLGETPGQHYNPYFASGALPDSCKDKNGKELIDGSLTAMPPQLTPDRVTYADGTKATTEQEAFDVATFLTWASDPHMEARKKLGFEVMIYLFILAGFLYVSYKKVWADVEH